MISNVMSMIFYIMWHTFYADGEFGGPEMRKASLEGMSEAFGLLA